MLFFAAGKYFKKLLYKQFRKNALNIWNVCNLQVLKWGGMLNFIKILEVYIPATYQLQEENNQAKINKEICDKYE